MDAAELQVAIIAARQRGDQPELQRLQAAYRRLETRANARGLGPGTTAVIDSSSAALPRPVAPGRPSRATVLRPAAPAAVPAEDSNASKRFGPYESGRPTVILSRRALEKIKAMRNFQEDGWWLIGPARQSARVGEIRDAIFAALPEDRSETALQIHLDEIRQINEARGPEEMVVGHAHSQPTDSTPSAIDHRTWRAIRETTGQDAFIGIVVKDRLTGPVHMRAFTVYPDGARSAHREANLQLRSH